MELKTKIYAEDDKHDLVIVREFDLPLELLFKAYTEPEIVEQWMGTKVLKLENKRHGSYEFETSDSQGNIVFKANGVIAEFVSNEKITRTFQMENTPFAVQLEFLSFEPLNEGKSKLTMQIVYKSVEFRNQMLALPFAKGLNMAHNRLQEVVNKLQVMTKRNKIIYWISTIWLSLGMLSTGIVQILKLKEEVNMMAHLGYPPYFLILIGVLKILGVVAILVPKFPLLKEWAYAGFFFTMLGAVVSHLAIGDGAKDFFGPLLLLLLTFVSWYFRPSDRKIILAN